MLEIEIFKRLETEIRATINSSVNKNRQRMYQDGTGRRLFLNEVVKHGLNQDKVVGGLAIVYNKSNFLSLDRIEHNNKKFKKKRRIIYYLDSRSGQIGSALLLELLKLDDGDRFSKPQFIRQIDNDYFIPNGLNISSGEINEALTRMFRRTMPTFFGVKGKSIVKNPFVLKMNELNVTNSARQIQYRFYKNQIDDQTYQLVRTLNQNFDIN